MNLTTSQREAIARIRDRGPTAWCDGVRGLTSGAIRRMFARLVAAGLVEGPPYRPTPAGLEALETYEARKRGRK